MACGRAITARLRNAAWQSSKRGLQAMRYGDLHLSSRARPWSASCRRLFERARTCNAAVAVGCAHATDRPACASHPA
ncbi:hypothetical protein XmelCFBP4644_07480 [Xanthomonas melonis]|uniref:Uncharacterized protein n=1 Tax=Xanthomonas melonis TaxID=56456 RepID=A0A2S7DHT2_9XANT|nr:hypothetical protein XmelCFBP4644_07480 [Xanthomonas melonis]